MTYPDVPSPLAHGGTARGRPAREPIALVGIACRLPGAPDVDAFWKLLASGGDSIRKYPGGRFRSLDSWYREREKRGVQTALEGGFLPDLDRFDASFFGLSPREAAPMDPQHRLLLETSWEALEDAGLVRERIAGSKTSVFMGIWASDYESRMFESGRYRDMHGILGGSRTCAAGRVSFAFDLRGPSLTLDTGCSSSLVAVLSACRSLWDGSSTLAIAGGASVLLGVETTEAFAEAGVLSPRNRCRFGDAGADGYVRSEGAGVVVLKPLSAAMRDGDPIRALILGGCVNSDGGSSGLLVAPSVSGQEALLTEAFRDAGVSPGELQYVEAHGTGTAVGDPVEIEALSRAFEGRADACLIGSVKSNIGHTEAAAGIAGLVKVVLAMERRAIPASLHVERPNPAIPWDVSPCALVREMRPWPERGRPIVAGVSSFGITGTNAHVVVSEAPARGPIERTPAGRVAPFMLPLSARSGEALEALVRSHLERLRSESAAPLADHCYTAAVRRSHHDFRVSVAGRTREDLASSLGAFLEGREALGAAHGRAAPAREGCAFVFSGHGSQWLRMCRPLLARNEVFRESVERTSRVAGAELGWSIAEHLNSSEDAGRLDQVDIVQPVLFAIAVGLAAVWESLGVVPRAVVGHSMGEVAAAHVSGALSLEDAVKVIALRSRLMRRARGGAMGVVALPPVAALARLDRYGGRLVVAGSNSRSSSIVAGDAAALEELLAELAGGDVFARRVNVDVASHCHHMDGAAAELSDDLRGIRPGPARIPFYSTVEGEEPADRVLDARYWAANLRRPVLFGNAIGRILAAGCDTFVELSPHPLLLHAIEEEATHAGRSVTTVGSLSRDQDEEIALCGALGRLYTSGYAVDWTRIYPEGGRCVPLPAYPWQRERLWLDDAEEGWAGDGPARGRAAQASEHPLVGVCVESSAHRETHFFDIDLSVAKDPVLGDHLVLGHAVLPASALCEMALASASAALGSRGESLENVVLSEPVSLPPGAPVRVQLVFTPDRDGDHAFEIRTRSGDSWRLNARGSVGKPALWAGAPRLEELTRGITCAQSWPIVPIESHYREWARRGVAYGEAFVALRDVRRQGDAAIARVSLPEKARRWGATSEIHPVLLDSCLQLAAVCLDLPDDPDENPYLPVSIASVRRFAPWEPDATAVARLSTPPGERARTGIASVDVALVLADGRIAFEAMGVLLKRASTRREHGRALRLAWVAEEPARAAPAAGTWAVLSSGPSGSGGGQEIADRLRALGARCFVGSVAPPNDSRPGTSEREDGFLDILLRRIGADATELNGVILADGLDDERASEGSGASLAARAERRCLDIAAVAGALERSAREPVARLWVVTSGVQAVESGPRPANLAEAAAWGIARVVDREHPGLRSTAVDLDPGPPVRESVDALARAIASDDPERNLAFRRGARFVARIEPLGETGSPRRATADAATVEAFHVQTSAAGVLENLELCETERRPPRAGEVEIEVAAAGLNFLDLAKAMGVYPGPDADEPVALGAECAGRVVRVGPDVVEPRVGDAVIATTPSYARASLLASHVTVPTAFVTPKPETLSFEEAATATVVFMTAKYALCDVARLRPGERVLVHSAAGGVGLAALQIARRIGAEVLATAGNEEKREHLRSLGIAHVFDSRSSDFAEGVLAATGGRGVDVVLNSLSGSLASASLALLAPFGRFVELGKRDIHDDRTIGLGAFRRNIGYSAVDLATFPDERPELLTTLMRDVVAGFAAGDYTPLPVTSFPFSKAEDAFRHMARARHIGKIALVPDPHGGVVVRRTSTRPRFRADRSYLVTGGLGEIGLEVARWLVGGGARHVILAGRRAPSERALAVIRELEAAGAAVDAVQADVRDERGVAALFAHVDATRPPLAGLFHAAGVLRPALLGDMDAAGFDAVFAPKATAAWHLHQATASRPLDHFVLFSSIAALFPQPGHGSYSAASAFLDALARDRRSRGLAGLSIDWGVWRDTGMTTAASLRSSIDDYAQRGAVAIGIPEALRLLGEICESGADNAIAMALDAERFAEAHERIGIPRLFSRIVTARETSPGAKDAAFRDELLAAPAEQREPRVEALVRSELARVLRAHESRIERDVPLGRMGLDSLMGLELVRRLIASAGVGLAPTAVFNHPTVRRLAGHVLVKLDLGDERRAGAVDPIASPARAAAVLTDVPESDGDAIRAIRAERGLRP